MKLTSEQAAYLAGAIDGEGSLQVSATARMPGATPSNHARITVANTNLRWLETLQSWTGGAIYKVGSPHSRASRRQCYRLEWRGAEAREVLPIVRPFLLIKAKHADLVLEYFDLASKRRTANGSGKPCDPRIVERIAEIRSEIKELNLRGVKSAPPRYLVPLAQLCAISSCGRRRYSNGYCKRHYRKYIERGAPKWHERACVVCGKPFVAKRSDARACSRKCSSRATYLARRAASRLPSPAAPEAVVQSQAVGDG